MTDIATTLSQAKARLAALQAEAAAAAAGGTAQTEATQAAWTAVAATEAAAAQADGQRTRILARDDTLTAALAARTAAIAEVELARTTGNPPPLADASATALRAAVAAAAGVSPVSKLDGADFRTAVAGVDTSVDTHDDSAASALAAASGTLDAARAVYAAKEALAEAALAAATGAAAAIAADLAHARSLRERAAQLAAAGDTAAAVVAYVDYQAARTRLGNSTAASAATQLQNDWTAARDAQLSAAADLLTAELAVIQRRLELARKRAEMGVMRATRDANAAAAVDAVLNPPPPPGP